MNINNIKNSHLKFSSDSKINHFGFDDSISKEKRAFLRESIMEKSMPYYRILENKKRLEKYELQKLISSLCGYKLNQDSLQNIFKHPQQSPIISEKNPTVPKIESITF